MVSITVRKLPEEVKEKLRILAAQKGMSLEAYLRNVLQEAANADTSPDIVALAANFFGKKHGINLEIPPMRSKRKPIRFNE